MELKELVGKKAVRTQSLWFDEDNNLVDLENDTYNKDEIGEDDSYTDGQYITVVKVTNDGVKYIQHTGPRTGEREFKFNNQYDQAFLDDNWEEWN